MNQIPNIEEWEEPLMHIMESYIMTAELGHLAKDQVKHNQELRAYYAELVDFITQQLQKAREEAVERIKAHGHKMKTAFNGKLPYVCWGENEENCRMSIYLKALDDTIKALQDNK